ncbi:MAG: hypothetical protein ACSLE1_03070 [Sphingobium sp.]
MTARNTVVPNISPLDEDEFHGHFMAMLGRLMRDHGAAKVAQALGYTTKRQLANLTTGSLPTLRGYYNLLALEKTAHAEVDKAYGQQKVDLEAVCSTEPLTFALICLAKDVAEAEDPSSPGGVAVYDSELRDMDEALVRKINRVTGTWIERLEAMRRPRVRAVQS